MDARTKANRILIQALLRQVKGVVAALEAWLAAYVD
jgi:hypothetical protein